MRISDWSSDVCSSDLVVANERATLYGLPVYTGRRVHFGKIDPVQARELFIRQALVTGEIDTPLSFLKHNRQLIAAIEKLEHQTRRPDILEIGRASCRERVCQ